MESKEKNYLFFKIFILLLVIFPVDKTFGKTIADVECKGTEEKLVYDCMISLSEMRTKIKVDSAKFVVGAEMPSMPGAHNIKPVMAHFMGNGIYHIRLNLEMYGEWVLRMDFKKPRRDRIVKKMIFGKNGKGMLNDDVGKHKHKKDGVNKSHGHDANHKHKDKGEPMEHDHNN